MAMAVHGYNSSPQRLELAHEPAAIDQCGADTFREGAAQLWVFHKMVMKSEDPMCSGKLFGNRGQSACLIVRDESKCVGERKCVSAVELVSKMPSPFSVAGASPSEMHRPTVVPIRPIGAGSRIREGSYTRSVGIQRTG